MKAIINIVLIAILIICTWSGYKKGIVMGVGGILAIIIALYGANLVSAAFSDEIQPVLRPFAAGFMDSRIMAEDGVMDKMDWSDSGYSAEDMLAAYPERSLDFASQCYRSIGIHYTTANDMAESAYQRYSAGGGSMLDCVIDVLCQTVAYTGLFILAFLLILIVLTVVGNLPNLSYKIPNLDLVNDICGAVLGLVTGTLFCSILVWALKFAGLIIGEDTLSSAGLASLMLKFDVVRGFIGI